MPDTSGDIYRDSGTEVAVNPGAVNFTDGLEATYDGDVMTVKVPASGITASLIADAAATPAKTVNTEARTATADGTGTGVVSATTTHVTVTSANADHIITLPAPVPGKVITMNVGSNGFELRSSAPATIAINGGAEADAESAIPANSTLWLICVSSTAWKGFYMDADSDLAKIPAAAAA